jgi:hypothetical protein
MLHPDLIDSATTIITLNLKCERKEAVGVLADCVNERTGLSGSMSRARGAPKCFAIDQKRLPRAETGCTRSALAVWSRCAEIYVRSERNDFLAAAQKGFEPGCSRGHDQTSEAPALDDLLES